MQQEQAQKQIIITKYKNTYESECKENSLIGVNTLEAKEPGKKASFKACLDYLDLSK